MFDATRTELLGRIMTLSEKLWEGHGRIPDVDEWLGNFDGRHLGDVELERIHALHLLSRVTYFGLAEIRVLLRAMYRDHFRYPIIQDIRTSMAGTRDEGAILSAFDQELSNTAFLGVGNPAESGTHLLYYFRQENDLRRSLFAPHHELFTAGLTDPSAQFQNPDLRRIVFVDDLCASGEQIERYSRKLLPDLRAVASRTGQSLTLIYLVLFGTTEALDAARGAGFDAAAAVGEIDKTYKTYGPESRLFRKPISAIDRDTSERIASMYGASLWPDWPLGFRDGQLLMAFHHNSPDNSLPILWMESDGWTPAFQRYGKS